MSYQKNMDKNQKGRRRQHLLFPIRCKMLIVPVILLVLFVHFAAAQPGIITAPRFNIQMIFDGLYYYIPNITLVENTNATGNNTWTNITSEHVINYWRGENFSDFNISSVESVIENQFLERIDPLTGNTTRISFRQRIRYSSWGINSPVQMFSEDFLFVWPFIANQKPYVDTLQAAFGQPQKIFLLNITLTQYVPPEPTLPSSLGNLKTGTVVPIALSSITAFAVIAGV